MSMAIYAWSARITFLLKKKTNRKLGNKKKRKES